MPLYLLWYSTGLHTALQEKSKNLIKEDIFMSLTAHSNNQIRDFHYRKLACMPHFTYSDPMPGTLSEKLIRKVQNYAVDKAHKQKHVRECHCASSTFAWPLRCLGRCTCCQKLPGEPKAD